MEKVLIVGQTPPPFGGQSLMIDKLLDATYENIQLYHVRLAFSGDMSEVGRFKLKKLIHLFYVIASIFYIRLRHGVRVLYYPPAGPDKIPMLRDFAILLSTRWLFKKTIFHFHAGGISELYPDLPSPLRFLFRKAYWYPDAAILLSELNPADGERLQAKKQWVIPYGLEDHFAQYQSTNLSSETGTAHILYVGLLKETKGVLDLIEACRILRERGLNFQLDLVGEFVSEDLKNTTIQRVQRYGLENHVKYLGVRTGENKWRQYLKAKIFCFPSYFESETFGLVVLEAMQFSLPVVATKWRGIPSLVTDGENGYLIPVKDPQALAEKIAILLKDSQLADTMGNRGRELFLQKFTLNAYLENIGKVFLSVGQ